MNRKTTSKNGEHTRSGKDRRSPKSTASRTQEIARRSIKATNAAARSAEAELVRFNTGDRTIDFNVDVTGETVWATQQQIADLFEVDQSVVSRHIKNVFDCSELADDTATHAKIASVQREGGRLVTREISHYSLDVILSVGYRVDSRAATSFRRWANGVLRSYIVRGYSLNERRLRSDRQAASELAARLRAIRADEQNVFATVRDFFKVASVDYDPSAKACRTFYALLQDKCHFAASGYTASQLILTRADYRAENMGLTTFTGGMPTASDAKVGKNYLSEEELHILHIVSEQFLLHVESKAIRNKKMTMAELSEKFDKLLRVGEYAIFGGYERYERGQADKHAVAQYARFLVRRRN